MKLKAATSNVYDSLINMRMRAKKFTKKNFKITEN